MDLVCYLHPGWEPGIRPAEPTRDWMDRTAEGFAYRCLPLNIANAHGWEVPCPCDFTAYWTGRPGTRDVVIQLGPDARRDTAPVSIFGNGVLTFHIFGLIRTPPGWNLWVGGSPNWWKEGVHPLSGVIETDWSPYSFTMNWRFTRRNHRIRFRKGEPICFFFPVQRGALEAMQPKYVPMQQDPELMAQFQAWSRSRDEFQAQVARNPPKAPADRWQKRYYRGVDMRDRSFAEHQAKLRLKPFVPGKASRPGVVPPPPGAAHCPVHAPQPETATVSLRTDAARLGRALRAVADGLARGEEAAALAERLAGLGLTPDEARRVIDAALAE